MPKWGIEMTHGTVNEWTARVGQRVAKGDGLLEVETEKIVNTVESPVTGVLRRALAEKGDTRPVGSLLGAIADEGVGEAEIDAFVRDFRGATVDFEPDAASPTVVPASVAPADSVATTGSADPESASAEGDVRVSPIARRAAERLGVDLSQVRGTGRNGRISKEDVEAFAAAQGANGAPAGNSAGTATLPPATAGNNSSASGTSRIPLTSLRRTIARRLSESAQTIPHYRVSVDADVDALVAARRRAAEATGERITLTDLLVKACGLALVQHPRVNAQFDGEEIVEHAHADIAIAVATPDGLIAPIARGADRLALAAVARACRDLIERAGRGALTRDDLTGGTFTISNLGMFGVARFDAIVNPPQVAILAVGAAEPRAVVRGGAVTVATRMTLTLSADHRVVDGAVAAAFLAALRERLEQPEWI
jgi:pyruvate dehydrogenase E2 component (dihydrolipoamide acetyltransferase)